MLILSDAPTIGQYSFKTGIDFIYMPRAPGNATPIEDAIGYGGDACDALAVREALIRRIAEVFRPHLFLVDEQPLGIHREIRRTVCALKARGTHLVLGLSDMGDHAFDHHSHGSTTGAAAELADLYDDIWIYGPREISDGPGGHPVADGVGSKASYIGYLCHPPAAPRDPHTISAETDSFILVTGGSDGAEIIDWVLSAYDYDPNLPYGCCIVLDPLMDDATRARLERRIEANTKIRIMTFASDLEMKSAIGVIGVGSYDTVCEILSTDLPAAVVPLPDQPAHRARAEQLQRLGLIQLLEASDIRLPSGMAHAIRDLGRQSHQPRSKFRNLFSGLDLISQSVDHLVSSTSKSYLTPQPERAN